MIRLWRAEICRSKLSFWFGPLAAPVEATGNVFSLTDVHQQSIESGRCVSQGLAIGVRSRLKHLVETVRRGLQFLQFFSSDLLLSPLSDGPNKACDSLADVARLVLVVFVIHARLRRGGSQRLTFARELSLAGSTAKQVGQKLTAHRS